MKLWQFAYVWWYMHQILVSILSLCLSLSDMHRYLDEEDAIYVYTYSHIQCNEH